MPNGSSHSTLSVLQSELKKLEDAVISPHSRTNFTVDHIISCTGDGASTQLKLNRLLEVEGGKKKGEMVENKCSMHLGVNLRYAQVKAMDNKGLLKDRNNGSTNIETESVPDEEESVPDEVHSLSDEEESVSDEEDSLSDEEESLSDEEESVPDEEESLSEEEESVPEEEESLAEEEESVPDEEESVPDEEESLAEEEESLSEEEEENLSEEEKEEDEERGNLMDEELLDKEESFLHKKKKKKSGRHHIDSEEVEVESDEETNGEGDKVNGIDIECNSLSVKSNRTKKREDGVDHFVYELCKLFGHVGSPEYCHGAASFPVFLAKEYNGDQKHYYKLAQTVRLKRYVGSRYYITSYNAARIFFLRNAMLAFLQEQKLLKKLNYLESTCLRKLNDNLLLTKLHLEGLIYDKVYCDLMTLVKSKDLDKSSLQMNIHYQELLQFLQNLASVPRLILDSEDSEPRLYSPDSKLNHRLHTPYIAVRNELYDQAFNVACSNQSLLLKMTSLVGHAMATKLKCDHLPGGKYFSPEAKTKSILSSLRPHNDMAESVFGSNDWLSYALPNMVQATRSVLIEFSYNKTMEWLKDQSKDQRELLISLAQARRRIAEREKKLEKENLLEQKIQNRIEAVEKAKLAQQKHVAVVTELESEQLISSPKELEQRINYIKALSLSRVLQENELKSVVKRQMKLRRFVYHQNTRISFTYNGKAKPVNELLTELSNVIASYPTLVRVRRKDSPSYQQLFTIFDKPSYLTRAKFKHQFEVDGDLQWFEGCIQKYVKNYFTLCYDTNEQCVFSLDEIKEDFYNGDFWII